MPTSLPVLDTNLEERVEQLKTPPASPVRTYEDAMADLVDDTADPRFSSTVKQGQLIEWSTGMVSPVASPVARVNGKVDFGIVAWLPGLDSDPVDLNELEEEYENYVRMKSSVEAQS
mmetsp:Transcript_26934/g.51974  ORF Transcript_26934/g.51974 Transcript_26934/m.51974 type:complete len:117 (-) Transcript_26934:135-485(-)